MPTVTMDIDKDALRWLRYFIKELNSQDNRITASPYYYTLRCPKQVFGVDKGNSEDFIWVDDAAEEIHAPEEVAVEVLQELGMEDCKRAYGGMVPEGDIPEKAEEVTDMWLIIAAEEGDWTKRWYRNEHEFKGVFFTEKAIFKHLEENKHRYPEGTDTYLEHAWRNPELKQLFENIGKLVGIPYERK